MPAHDAARFRADSVEHHDCHPAHDGDSYEIIQRAARVKYGDQAPVRFQNAGDFALRSFHVRNMVQHTMRKNHVETVRSKWYSQGTGAFQSLVGKSSHSQSG